MSDKPRTAVVVGAGIGGLAAAVGLHRTGWHVVVFERAATPAEIGAGITLWPNAVRALDWLGVGRAVRGYGGTRGTGAYRLPHGMALKRTDTESFERTFGAPLVVLHRADLHRVLRDALPDDTVIPGKRVVGVDTADGAARVRLDDGTARAAGLVIGADGVRSAVRSSLFPDHPGPAYAGVTAWRAVARVGRPLTSGGETFGVGRGFGVVSMSDEQVYWFASARAEEGGRSSNELADLRHRFGRWHEPIPTLLDTTPPEAVVRHDIYEIATPLPSYVRGRVALLGDAAHAMTPNLGQGACQALEDAVTLAAVTAAWSDDIGAALASYDAQRRPRTQDIVRRSAQMARRTLPTGAVAARLRDLGIALSPGFLMLRMLGPVLDWSPPGPGPSSAAEPRPGGTEASDLPVRSVSRRGGRGAT